MNTKNTSINILWTPTTSNQKTGNIPTGYIGQTKEETKASCQGCPQFRDSNNKTRCYAWGGLVHAGLLKVQETAAKSPFKYTLDYAIKHRNKKAKAVRIAAIGDPGRFQLRKIKHIINKIRKNGLAVLNYTHHWRELDPAKYSKLFMASCDTLEEAEQATKLGFRATAIVPYNWADKNCLTPNGARAIVCPAIWGKRIGLPANKVVTCNECKLCDPARNGPIILFPNHGPQTRGGKRLKTL